MANIIGTLVPDLILPGGSLQGELLPDLSGDDIIDGREADDAISASGGNDSVQGGLGNDQVFGNAGNDTLRGDAGSDSLYGGQGDDVMYGDDGVDIVFADLGNDTGYGGAGDDFVFGNKGNDVMYGGEGNDSVFGGQDNDSIFGDAGNDMLFGDLGADTVEGGAGNDVFVLSKRNSGLTSGGASVSDADLIKDFAKGEDKFMLDGLQFTDLNIQANGGNSTIQDRTTNQFLAVVEGVTDLDVTDFSGAAADPGPQGALQFSAAAYTGVEGSDAANPGKALITVTRTDGSEDPISVGYKVTPGVSNPALAGGIDFFETTDGLLTFAAGETEKTFEVLLPADPGTTNIADDGKTVSLSLFNPSNGAVLGEQSAAVLTIGDSAGSGAAAGGLTFEFVDEAGATSVSNYSVDEADGGSGVASFEKIITVRRNQTAGSASIFFNTIQATALENSDYTPTTGELKFEAGQALGTFAVSIVNDGTAQSTTFPTESDSEFLTLQLTSSEGGVEDAANLFITQNNAQADPSELRFEFVEGTVAGETTNIYSVNESQGTTLNAAFPKNTFIKRNTTEGEDTIFFNAFDATATSPNDFISQERVAVAFADGQEFATVPVQVINDGTTVNEPPIENASLTLEDNTGNIVDSANLIINNQAAPAGAGFSFGTGIDAAAAFAGSIYSAGSTGAVTGGIGLGTGAGPNGPFLNLTVFRANVASAETVDYAITASTTGSNATADPDGAAPVGSTSDFVPVSGQLSFGVGEFTKDIQIPTFFDGSANANEFINAELTGDGLGLYPKTTIDIL